MKKALKEDVLKIGGISLKVAILDSGERVIEQESFIDFLEALGRDELSLSAEDGKKIAQIINSRSLGE